MEKAKNLQGSLNRTLRRLKLKGSRDPILRSQWEVCANDEFEFLPLPRDCVDASAPAAQPAQDLTQCDDLFELLPLPTDCVDDKCELLPLPTDCVDDKCELLPLPTNEFEYPPQPSNYVPAAQPAKDIPQCDNLVAFPPHPNYCINDATAAAAQPASDLPQGVEDTSGPSRLGILKNPASDCPKKPLRFNRKTLLISTSQEHCPCNDSGRSSFSVEEGDLLPPRRYTPSPESPYYRGKQPRSETQMLRRRALETTEERMEECVPSREPRDAVEERFGDISEDTELPPLPPRCRRIKVNRPMALWEVSRWPTFEEWCKRQK